MRLALVLLAGCSPAMMPVPDSGQPVPLMPPPAEFDCTGPMMPARVSTTPVSCLFDRSCRTRLVSGHRGAGGDLGNLAPEDTLAAYRAAIVLGIDYAETDPRPTKDGVIVNVHDTTVDRVTNGTGTVADMTLAELKALTFRTDKYTGDFSCERIATLEELLRLCVGRVAVLVDANKTDRVDLLVKAIQDAGALEWAIFDTSSVTKIDQALALEPSLLTMIRVGSVADLDSQLTHFAAHPPIIVEVDRNSDAKDVATATHDRGHRPFTDVFVEDVVVALDGTLRTYDKAWALGIDIAQTERPAELMRYLKRR